MDIKVEKLAGTEANLDTLKIRISQIENILKLRKSGISVERIAVQYSVSSGCINRILKQNGMK